MTQLLALANDLRQKSICGRQAAPPGNLRPVAVAVGRKVGVRLGDLRLLVNMSTDLRLRQCDSAKEFWEWPLGTRQPAGCLRRTHT